MKTRILTIVLLFLSFSGFSQTDNPYAAFGYEGKVLTTPQERMEYMLLIPNIDSTSNIAVLGIEPAKGVFYLFDKNNEILSQGEISQEKLAKFLSVDPSSKDYPWNSSYAFAENRVIDGVDLEGLEYFYMADGSFLGKTGTSQIVHVITADVTKEQALQGIQDYNMGKIKDDAWKKRINSNTRSLGVTIDLFTAYASMIDHESGGNRLESLSIGTATINFLKNGGSKQLKTLDDVVLYDNWFAQGATQSHLNKFAKSSNQNRKYAVESAINGLMYQQGVGGVDYSNGADSWDGIDLVLSKNSKGKPIYNSHRKYIWNSSSKSVLNSYSNKFGDINTNNWKYKAKGYQVETTSQYGGTIFTDIQTGRGEGKQSQEKFTVPQQ